MPDTNTLEKKVRDFLRNMRRDLKGQPGKGARFRHWMSVHSRLASQLMQAIGDPRAGHAERARRARLLERLNTGLAAVVSTGRSEAGNHSGRFTLRAGTASVTRRGGGTRKLTRPTAVELRMGDEVLLEFESRGEFTVAGRQTTKIILGELCTLRFNGADEHHVHVSIMGVVLEVERGSVLDATFG